LDLATVLLFFPLLGGARQSSILSQLVEEYGDRRAAQTAAACLRALPSLSGEERPVARFLLGNDLAELGAYDLGTHELLALVDSPDLGASAFVALARVYDESGERAELLSRAQHARWADMRDDDFAETAYRVAGASLREGRAAQARDWAARIPADSPYYASSRLLLLQAQYALGRPGAALDAAEEVFGARTRTAADRWLQDRTAVVAGDLLTEIGQYGSAIDVLDWPSSTSPFHDRAARDRRVAQALLSASVSSTELTDVDELRITHESEIIEAAGAKRQRSEELRKIWPSQRLTRERRRWAAAAARAALDAHRGIGWRRPLEVLWKSLPPVAIYEMLHRAAAKPTRETEISLDAQARFFFAPRPEVARWLTALAAASQGAAADDCGARAIALRAAAMRAAVEPPATVDELQKIASRCVHVDAHALDSLLEAKLEEAIDADASRRLIESREQAHALSTALADAELQRKSRLDAAGGTDR
jgi:hypothetical protein